MLPLSELKIAIGFSVLKILNPFPLINVSRCGGAPLPDSLDIY